MKNFLLGVITGAAIVHIYYQHKKQHVPAIIRNGELPIQGTKQ